MAVGRAFACGTRSAGGVACWGSSTGDAATGPPLLTAPVARIAAGGDASCAIVVTGGTASASLRCFGALGSATGLPPPPIAAVSVAGAVACAVLGSADVQCFGATAPAGLACTAAPSAGTPFTSVAAAMLPAAAGAGAWWAVGVSQAGALVSWGCATTAYGLSATLLAAAPAGSSGYYFAALAPGAAWACALRRGAGVQSNISCWGPDAPGAVGGLNPGTDNTPGPGEYVELAVGATAACLLTPLYYSGVALGFAAPQCFNATAPLTPITAQGVFHLPAPAPPSPPPSPPPLPPPLPPGAAAVATVNATVGLAGYTVATFDAAARRGFTTAMAAALSVSQSAISVNSVTDYTVGAGGRRLFG